jgi:predicted DNA-binding protein (MmcQ/YjbR family)
MNKVHWNSVKIGGDVDDQLLRQLIQDSYNLVFDKLTKKIKNEIEMG